MKFASVFTAMMFAPVVSFADTVTPPQGCEAFLTVQFEDCTVSHYWRCDGDQQGVVWTSMWDAEGELGQALYDAEFRWLFRSNARNALTEHLVEPESDANSLLNLFATGTDHFEFEMEYRVQEWPAGRAKVVGFDKLTGETTVIDGYTFENTEYEMRRQFPSGHVRDQRGSQYILRDYNLIMGGTDEVREADGGMKTVHRAPVTITAPGEDGFLTDTPLYGCDEMLSALPFSELSAG